MPWKIFEGKGVPRQAPDGGNARAWEAIPPPPPWRPALAGAESRPGPVPFEMTDALCDAVNAALHLRRPLLLTGPPGSGKSSLVELLAAELDLGEVLRWHVTSRSTLEAALFGYDALGRLQATQLAGTSLGTAAHQPSAPDTSVEHFVTLGPLGTALANRDRPRALLIDEIDKSDFDLPGDLLNVLERGEFTIPPLQRDAATRAEEDRGYTVRGADGAPYDVGRGSVRARHFPVMVFTSNGERTFPGPFLRRCIQFDMPSPDDDFLASVVAKHLGREAAERQRELIASFGSRLRANRNLAVDQLLNVVYLAMGPAAAETVQRDRLNELVLRELGGR